MKLRTRTAAAVVAVTALAGGSWSAGADAATKGGGTTATGSTTVSSIAGGGFINVVAFAPGNSSRAAAGGDVSGAHISDDNGRTWRPINAGLRTSAAAQRADRHIGALWFSDEDTLWALTGAGVAAASRLVKAVRSTSGDWSWTPIAGSEVPGTPQFVVDGTNGGGAYGQRPRPTGALLAPANSTTLLGMTQRDLLRVNRSTSAVTAKAMPWKTPPAGSGPYLATGLAVDPLSSSASGAAWAWSTVRVLPNSSNAAGLAGVWLDRDPTGTTAACQVPSPTGTSTASPQEIAAVAEPDGSGGSDTVLYTAWGEAGVYRAVVGSDPCAGLAWTKLAVPQSSPAPCESWSTVTAARNGSATVVWLGCDAESTTDGVNALWRVDVTGTSGTPVFAYRGVGAAGVSNTLDGTTTPWWHVATSPTWPAGAPAQVFAREGLGGGAYISSQLVVDPSDLDVVMTSGKGGVWRTTTGSAAQPVFAAAMTGLGSTIAHDVEVDPADPAKVAVGDVDWGVIMSGSRLTDVPWSSDPNAKATDYPKAGWFLAFSNPVRVKGKPGKAPRPLFTWGEGGNGVNPTNDYFGTLATPFAAGNWAGYGGATPAASVPPRRLLGLAAGVDRSDVHTAVAVIDNVAPTLGTGVVYNDGTGWVDAALKPASVLGKQRKQLDLVWGKGRGVAFLFDHEAGVWRTSNAGRNWTQILTFPVDSPQLTAHLAYDRVKDRLIVARVDAAQVTHLETVAGATKCAIGACLAIPMATVPSSLRAPAAVTVDAAGHAWIAQGAYDAALTVGTATALYEETSPGVMTERPAGWYRSGALEPNALASGAGCGSTCLYLATQGNGTLVVSP